MIGVHAPFRVRGGVHPRYFKEATADRPIETLPVPARLLVSTAQHLGAPSKPLVKKGDAVARGQRIAEAAGFVSAHVHAPASGTVKAVATMLTASARPATVIEIETDGRDRAADALPPIDWQTAEPKALVARVAEAGIIGMGGAGFPTHVKLSPPPDKPIGTLIVNGAECEPYLTADDRLMVEQAERVWAGARILRRILGAGELVVAAEDNKPHALAAMGRAMDAAPEAGARLVSLATAYPQGAEKQLIRAVTGREVPSGGLPMDVAALVENVGTAAAVADAVREGRPLIERVVTVTGAAVIRPANLLARVGAPFADLLAACGGTRGDAGKAISGGPMMGIALPTLDVGVAKTTSGVLILPRGEVAQFSSLPCIACGRCVIACPAGLLPCTLSECIESEKYLDAEALNVMDCIECGACAFECPSRRPLVQHLRQGKARAVARRRQQEARARKEARP